MRPVAIFLTVAALFLALANSSPGASREFPTLFSIKQNDKWGFIDRTGKVIVPPQFKNAKEFSEGRAGVKVKDKFGFIDQTGKVVIPIQFDKVREFSEGLAAVEIGRKWGFVDKSGKMVISPRFTETGSFHEGRWIREGEIYRYIDQEGHPAFSLRSEIPGNFATGVVRIRLEGKKYGYADKSRKIILEPRFLEASQFTDGLGRVHIDCQTWGFADRTGKIVIRLQADMAGQFAEGRAPVAVIGRPVSINETSKALRRSATAETRSRNKENTASAPGPGRSSLNRALKTPGAKPKEGEA